MAFLQISGVVPASTCSAVCGVYLRTVRALRTKLFIQ